ncbi:hypothetical protein DFH08DRAFT_917082 [Mycena albidolilacea]|uniref:Uncharacterized protein n=1 Tax=Mycena albidolilacea TaxID=1033008 RepID=A0AAD6ZH64_9AGAR|nr:hypothetical protein DFH08DRAFT_917082 [Mycena albidolilacea]
MITDHRGSDQIKDARILSDDQLKTIIWVMHECGTPDIPSFSALRKKQVQLTKDVNIQTVWHVSAMGNEFYMNHPVQLLALDWANPLVREFMQVYPEITDQISEMNQADKWTKEVDLDDLSPMWADWKMAAHKHYYIKELAQLKNGEFVIPMRWVIFNKEEYTKVYKVIHYPEVTQNMPNPVRQIAEGRPVFSIRIIPWTIQSTLNVYMANANLPHRKVSQECFVQFCSTSPHASAGEQLEALTEDIGSEKYHKEYNCKLEQDILFHIFAHVLPANNPQQAESASNAGVHTNLWCRYDMAGGAATHRETDEGYRALFKPGIPHTPAQTIQIIKRQIWAACSGVQDADKTALFWVAKLIVKARETQKERFGSDPRLKDKKLKGEARKAVKTRIKGLIQWELYNWVILQPEDRSSKLLRNSCDSPCEILHSILLGDDKYIWHETNTPWDKSKGDKFAVRLQSSSTNGLNLSSVRGRYIHFKILQQLGIFHLHEDLCSKNLFNLWKASGELGALLWFPKIQNLEQYLNNLQVCIDNVLDLWALVNPARIVTKYKLHVLPHLPEDVRWFRPAILFTTEGFKCWNAIFRLCSVLSNHQSPSHDIGVTLADMERFKHQVSGGWWKPDGSQDYVQAGREIIAFLEKNKELQRRLGWIDKSKPKPGSIKLESRRTATSASWREILGWLWKPELDSSAGKTWTTCKYVVSKSGDVCTKDSWVFFKCKFHLTDTNTILVGRICIILIPTTASARHSEAVVVIHKTRDIWMNMPVLSPSPEIQLAQPAV